MEYIISILTFFLGFIIAEIIRRMNRAEAFNAQIFNKRLDVYCELYALWNKTYTAVTALIESIIEADCVDENALDNHLNLVIPLMNYMDKNSLFISEELVIQCGSAFLGFGDLSKDDSANYLSILQEQNKIVTAMIRDESGLSMLNKNIKSIIDYKHKSPIITYFHKAKREVVQK